MSERRVVVTGMGIISPLGCDLESFWSDLTNGVSGIGPLTYFDTTDFTSKIGGQVKGFEADKYISAKERKRMDLFTQYGISASIQAIEHSGLNPDELDLDRVGVLFSSGIGGLQVMQDQSKVLVEKGAKRLSPFMIPQMITNIAAGHIAIQYGFRGPNFCLTSACASATHSIGEALRIVQRGDADIMISGGSEAPLCELGVGGFCSMRALSTRNDDPQKASRPFDRDRDGFVIAEGGATLVLEEYEHAKKRGAQIICEVAGYGRTCDAYHITAPAEGGVGAAKGMSIAVKDAGLNPEDIDYINAHGTSTELNDKGETAAIKAALGEDNARKLAISSIKSMTGHTLGAAGGVESIACALAMKNGVVPPTINLDNPDELCDLDYVPHTAREMKVKACLNNSLGFGGHNATLCFKALD